MNYHSKQVAISALFGGANGYRIIGLENMNEKINIRKWSTCCSDKLQNTSV